VKLSLVNRKGCAGQPFLLNVRTLFAQRTPVCGTPPQSRGQLCAFSPHDFWHCPSPHLAQNDGVSGWSVALATLNVAYPNPMEIAEKAIAITEARKNFIEPPLKVKFADVI
jgi:hypothetical protein